MPETSLMKEDQYGPKSQETIPGLGNSKNTVRFKIFSWKWQFCLNVWFNQPPESHLDLPLINQ